MDDARKAWIEARTTDEWTEELRNLTIGEVLDRYTSEWVRVENLRLSHGGADDPRPDYDEALATLGSVSAGAHRLLGLLRWQWGITLFSEEKI